MHQTNPTTYCFPLPKPYGGELNMWASVIDVLLPYVRAGRLETCRRVLDDITQLSYFVDEAIRQMVEYCAEHPVPESVAQGQVELTGGAGS